MTPKAKAISNNITFLKRQLRAVGLSYSEMLRIDNQINRLERELKVEMEK